MTELYNLARGSLFKLLPDEDVHVPPAAPDGEDDVIYKLGSIDGMYSWSIGPDKERYYFAAWTEVEEVSDGNNSN